MGLKHAFTVIALSAFAVTTFAATDALAANKQSPVMRTDALALQAQANTAQWDRTPSPARPATLSPSRVDGVTSVGVPPSGAQPAPDHDLAAPNGNGPPPFGASLFARPLRNDRPSAINSEYVIVPGDRIAVHVWGATVTEQVAVVDAQGNIFVPAVGPVAVGGITSAELDRRVRAKVASVYTDNVDVYVNVLTSTPVEVFVSGAVVHPGQYAGQPTDSALAYLHRAGGIDNDRGSYRRIKVLRQGRVVAEADLYDFLRNGVVPGTRFKDGDVILVEERGAAVTVDGPTLNPFRFELSGASAPGSELAGLAKPLPDTSHVAVSGTRGDGPFSVYVPLDKFGSFVLQDGDRVRFEADQYNPVMAVSVEGSHIGPSFYTVKRTATLDQFLNHVWVDPDLAATESIYVKRQSVAREQKEMLDRSLRQLEQAVLTAPVE
ncbi:MAG TPA: polysaccharide biosynthesis/export family protein, partial [Rhodospirillales bacterium]|nr:polysaccharide biosynthesis/export family protein [Rhodospirillales bacterium]